MTRADSLDQLLRDLHAERYQAVPPLSEPVYSPITPERAEVNRQALEEATADYPA